MRVHLPHKVKPRFGKLSNEYVLALITAAVLVLASALSLLILAAALNFSTEPVENDDNQAKIINVKPMPIKKAQKNKASNQNKQTSKNGFKTIQVIKIKP